MAALARVERTDFLSPMCIGEVAHVSAEITYTSKHSVEVQVNVESENILTGKPQDYWQFNIPQPQRFMARYFSSLVGWTAGEDRVWSRVKVEA